MATTVFIIPQKGLLVRDPMSMNPLAEDGEIKPLTGKEGRYWRRRIKDGTVIINEPKKIKRSKK